MSSLFPYLSLAAAMAIVGSSVVAGKIMIQAFPVCLASALRFALALCLLAPLLFWKEGGLPALSRRSWGVLALQGLCGSFLFTILTLGGLRLASAANAGIITSATPGCMGLLAWGFLKERPTARAASAVALSAVGIAILNLRSGAQPAFGANIQGNAMFLAAVLVESIFLLLRKAVPEKLSPLAAATLVSLFGLAYFTPAALVQAAGFDFTAAPAASWLAVGYSGLFVTVAAYLLWFAGIMRVSAQAAGAMTGVMPVASVTLAWGLLGESPRTGQWVGCLLVMAAILISASGNGRRIAVARNKEKELTGQQGSKSD